MKPTREGGRRQTIILSLIVAAVCIGILLAVLAVMWLLAPVP